MKKISYDEALALLERAIEENGPETTVDPTGCTYFVPPEGDMYAAPEADAKPSCILGHALSYLGVTPDQLRRTPTGLVANVQTIWTLQQEGMLGQLGIELDPQAYQLWYGVQNSQDCSIPWGEALQRAKLYVDSDDE